MNSVFADTAYYLAFLNEDDDHHAEARLRTEEIREPIVTTRWVLTEVADALCRPRDRQIAVQFIRGLESMRTVEIVPATDELFHQGFALYSTRPDKGWSLTDCISFIIMRAHDLQDALTSDRHFQQAGFNVLLGVQGR